MILKWTFCVRFVCTDYQEPKITYNSQFTMYISYDELLFFLSLYYKNMHKRLEIKVFKHCVHEIIETFKFVY